eukprot:CAMPEP_0175027442 /NCGR_PEP_ID=MMETSP0005-20121125/18364_1 /TAXON_ID=420556 /ORGANISM="Ochromonas sp., Strain CCMP1393" /LENGTH=49 /DNA_ID= /DNA_START= /DNA_END= /DNA_ORIENTATION=
MEKPRHYPITGTLDTRTTAGFVTASRRCNTVLRISTAAGTKTTSTIPQF